MSNQTADKCYAFVKGDGPEPYSPAVAALYVFVDAIEEEAFKRGFEAGRDYGDGPEVAWKDDVKERR